MSILPAMQEGIQRTLEYLDKDFEGLCFINLVDYDMLYGHRRDVDGYAKALAYFDEKLPEIQAHMSRRYSDDHGGSRLFYPAYTKTYGSYQRVTPFLMYGAPVSSRQSRNPACCLRYWCDGIRLFRDPTEFEGNSVLRQIHHRKQIKKSAKIDF